MTTFLGLTVVGLVTGCIYALTASGLVVTYITSGVFNFAHGAIGMIAAFTYWQLVVADHWPAWAGLVAVLAAAALSGALIEKVLMRPLRGSSPEVSMVVTIGLMLALLGLATEIWRPSTARIMPQLFAGHTVTIFGIVVTFHQLTVFVAAVAVAVALRLFLYRTGAGIATRAVVDNDQLAALSGASPARYGQLGWAVGAMLAALAGILLAPLVTLDAQTLTLLVVDGYAAAMLGRLRNLPLTFAGGLLIGVGVSYAVGYLPGGNVLSDVEPAVPVALLFAFLLAMPQRPRRTPRLAVSALRVPRVPSLPESLIVAVAFVAIVFVVSGRLSAASLLTAGHGFALAIIALSLVPLTGYSGQPSLCQLTFAGLGAYAMGQVDGGGSLLGLVAAVGLAGAVGAVIALPALRLQGLYLALATLAFAELMDTEFFGNTNVFGLNLAIFIGRVNLPGISLQSDQAYLVMLAVVFAAAAVGVLALRRSVFGRRLAAMGDSAQNAASVGVSINWARLAIFAGSAGLAGLGGALYGGQQGAVGPDDFSFLASLVLVLLVYLGGIRSVAGVFVASMISAILPLVQAHITALSNIAFLFTGLAAISLGRNPNGMIGNASPREKWRERQARKLPDAPSHGEEQHVSAAL